MLAFRLIQSEKSLECYPFEFELIITYRLKGSSVSIEYTVHNPGSKELIFSVGGHPGFNVPFAKDGTEFTDYYLEFDKPADVRSIVMSPTCYTTREEHPFIMENGVRLALKHELFDNDAIVLDDPCRAVSIKNGKNDRFVRVEYPDMSYLGLWQRAAHRGPVCMHRALEQRSGIRRRGGRSGYQAQHDKACPRRRIPQHLKYQRKINITAYEQGDMIYV